MKTMNAVVYDIETYKNCFQLAACSLERDDLTLWEISDRRNDIEQLLNWFQFLAQNRVDMIGFNNVHFDYTVIHEIITNPSRATSEYLHMIANQIINGDKFDNIIWPNERIIPQVDLFKIHHFDNAAKSTSLKALQFTMRAESIEDLPFHPMKLLTFEEMDINGAYCCHDVTETKRFAKFSKDQIEFRRDLQSQLSGDVMNFNDTKIGKQYFIQELGEDICYERNHNNKKVPKQTYRSEIRLKDIILPYIRFDHPEFIRIYSWLWEQTLTDTKGVFSDVSCEINGFTFNFGTGGIHGSVERKKIESDETHIIIDVDVESLYPSIAIVNNLYPAHLGQIFVDKYAELKRRRVSYPKGTAPNAMLKLALNGVYGDSNNIYSPFFDPQYTMSITINGQLLLCMLAEMIMNVPGIELIQINTDGLTVKCPKSNEWLFDGHCEEWERITKLKLEKVKYSRMWIRDVNSYVAEYEGKKKYKSKGAYVTPDSDKDYEGVWHKDWSALVVARAAKCQMIDGVPVEIFINTHFEPFDFMLRGKAPRNSFMYIGDKKYEQRILRYFVSNDGAPMYKVSPPVDQATAGDYKKGSGVSWPEYHKIMREIPPGTWDERIHTKNKSIYEDRKTAICAGWNVTECNRANKFDWLTLNRDWYIQEAKKLVIE